jgi:hypothetical protein
MPFVPKGIVSSWPYEKNEKSPPVIIPVRFAHYSDAILPCEVLSESDINDCSQRIVLLVITDSSA